MDIDGIKGAGFLIHYRPSVGACVNAFRERKRRGRFYAVETPEDMIDCPACRRMAALRRLFGVRVLTLDMVGG